MTLGQGHWGVECQRGSNTGMRGDHSGPNCVGITSPPRVREGEVHTSLVAATDSDGDEMKCASWEWPGAQGASQNCHLFYSFLLLTHTEVTLRYFTLWYHVHLSKSASV